MQTVQTVDEGGERLTFMPGDIAAQLGVSGSTFRRISQDYEQVFDPLPRDQQNRRNWTPEAVRRVVLAHEAVREGYAESTRAALLTLKEGGELVRREGAPIPPDAGGALAKLDDLAAQVQRQGEGIAQLLRGLDERDTEIAAALRALANAQDAQAQALRELREEVRARPAPAPPSATKKEPPAPLLLRLVRALFGQ